jgi:hypothetical protein
MDSANNYDLNPNARGIGCGSRRIVEETEHFKNLSNIGWKSIQP